MTANLTPAEARAHNAAVEAAAQVAYALVESGAKWDAMVAARAIERRIRALSVPIPPEPDVEAVVEMVARAACPLAWDATIFSTVSGSAVAQAEARRLARAVVAALTAAGMLR